MATKINRTFKLPAQPAKKIWSLSAKEMLFLDMTMFLSLPHGDLYRMTVKSDITDAQCRTRASALMTSFDGKDYLEVRTSQLQEHYWPEAERPKEKKRGKDGFSEDFVPTVIRKLETIVNNPDDPNYFDGIKVALTKVMKDMETGEMAEPPKRYLPEVCGNCRYKNFVEQECIDECKICKYKAYANDNGVAYTFQDQLDRSLANEIQEINQ